MILPSQSLVIFVNKCDFYRQEAGVPHSILVISYYQTNSVALDRKRTIPTERCQGDQIKEDGVEKTSAAYRILLGESAETIWVTWEDNIKLDLK
jgi:hypothetical protein